MGVKCFPSNWTVSIPTWINISAPLSVVIPSACPVGKNVVTVPSAGAITLPSTGLIAIPFPNAPEAKAASCTSLKLVISPFNGLIKISSLTKDLVLLFSVFSTDSLFSSSLVKNIKANPEASPAIVAIIIPQNPLSIPSGFIHVGITNNPIAPDEYILVWNNPIIPPVTAPPIQLNINGFFLGKVTP